MFDDRTSRRDGGDDLTGLPPDAQALYHTLRDDGAAWRASTPELGRVGERLRDRARQLTTQHAMQEGMHEGMHEGMRGTHSTRPTRTTTRTRIERYETRRLPRGVVDQYPPRRSGAHRVAGWVAAASAVGLVAALAALLLAAAPGRSNLGGQPGPTGTSPQGNGRWVSLDPLSDNASFSANDLPVVAPSDPRVVYQSFAQGIQEKQPASLRRTDDGGASWHALALPVPAAHIGHAGFIGSPLAAHTVFLTLIDTVAADCPPGTAQPMSESVNGGVLCWLEYTSTDGGAHWAPTKLPAPGTLTPNITNNSSTVFAAAPGPDGKPRLYAILSCAGATANCLRLVASADGGLSWQYADGPLMAEGAQAICATTADGHGTSIYAVTTASADCGWNSQQPLTLWRSDDAGAHWTSAGALATPNIRGMRVAHTADGKALLYAAEPKTTQMATDKMGGKYPLFSNDPSDLKVSADGGKTWTVAPSAGVPAGTQPYYDNGLLGTLSDGSIVVEVVSQPSQGNFTGGTLLAWKPGESAWRALAPAVAQEVGALTVVPTASGVSGDDTLYLLLVNRGGNGNPGTIQPPTYSFARFTL